MDHWREPDRGIWEVRGEPRHFTSSKLMCWVAVDRGARLAAHARRRRSAPNVGRPRPTRSTPDICAHGVDERGVFVQHYDDEALDASLLLLPLVRFLPPDDPRLRATVLAIADELTEDGLVLRYRVETDRRRARQVKKARFTICSFWLVSALVEIGELARARALCEKLLVARQPAGALCRGDRPGPGRHLG